MPQTNNPSPASPDPVRAAKLKPLPTLSPAQIRKRRVLWAVGILGSLLLVLVLVILLLPSIVSLSPVRAMVVSRIDRQFTGSLQINSWSLSWSKGQQIRGVVLRNSTGEDDIFHATVIDAPDLSLWALVTGSRDLGTITIQDPNLHIVQNYDGSTNLQMALVRPGSSEDYSAGSRQPPAKPAPLTLPSNLHFKLVIDNCKTIYEAPRMQPLELAFDATVDAPTLQKITADIDVKSRQQESHGSALGKLAADNLFDNQGQLQWKNALVNTDIKLEHFPMTPVDRFFRQRSKLVAVVGRTLTATLQGQGNLDKFQAGLFATGERMSVDAQVRSDNQVATLQEGTKLKFTFTPESYTTLVMPRGYRRMLLMRGETPPGEQPEGQAAAPAPAPAGAAEPPALPLPPNLPRLLEPFDLTVVITQLQVPMKGQTPDLANAAVTLSLQSTPIKLQTTTTTPMTLTIKDLVTSIESAKLAGDTRVKLSATAEQPGQTEPGSVQVNVQLKDLLDGQSNLSLDKLTAVIQGNLQRFPVPLADQFAGTNGLLAVLIGPSLDATLASNLQQNADGATGSFRLDAQARSLKSLFNGQFTGNRFTLAQGSGATLQLEPETYRLIRTRFLAANSALANMDLAQPATVRLDVSRMIVPMVSVVGSNGEDTVPALGQIAMDAVVSAEQLTLDNVQSVGRLTLRDTKVTLTSDRLEQTIQANLVSQAQTSSGTGQIKLQSQLQNLVNTQGQLTLDKLKSASTGTVERLPIGLIDTLGNTGGKLTALLGSNLTLNIKQVQSTTDTQGSLNSTFNIDASSELMAANLIGTFSPQRLALDPKSQIKLQLQPQGLAALLPPATAGQSSPRLLAPATIQVLIDAFDLPLAQPVNPAQATLGARIGVDRLSLANLPGLPGPAPLLGDVKITVPKGKLSDPVKLNLTTQIARNTTEPQNAGAANPNGQLTIDATVSNLLGSTTDGARAVQAKIAGKSLPVGAMDDAAAQRGLLLALLGTQVDQLDVSASTTLPEPGAALTAPAQFDVNVQSTALKVTTAGQYVPNQTLALKDNTKLEFTLSPQGYAALQTRMNEHSAADAGTVKQDATGQTRRVARPSGSQEFRLAQPFTLVANLKQVQVGLRPAATAPAATAPNAAAAQPLPIDPARTKLVADLSASPISFQRVTDNQFIRINELKSTVQTQDPSKALTVAANALFDVLNDGAQAATAQKGSLTSNTTIQNLITPANVIDFANARIQTDTQIQNMPVPAVDRLLLMDGQLQGLLGQSASLVAKGDFTPAGAGALDVKVDSQNANMSLPLVFNQGVMGLKQDATATLRVTPELSRTMLKKLTGWVEAETGEKPIQLKVLQQGFAVPTKDFDVSKVQANAVLEMGTLRLAADSPVTGAIFLVKDLVLGLLQKGGEEKITGLIGGLIGGVTRSGKLTAPATVASFSPMNVQMQSGIVRYDDLSMNVEGIVTQFRGSVNLTNKANSLVMTVVGESLGKLSRGNALSFMRGRDITVPIGGTYDKPEIDAKALVTAVPRIVTAGGAKETGQGVSESVGGVIQGIEGVITGRRENNASQPPPQQQPQQGQAQDQQQQQQQNQQQPQQKEQPKKKRGLGGLLDEVLQ